MKDGNEYDKSVKPYGEGLFFLVFLPIINTQFF